MKQGQQTTKLLLGDVMIETLDGAPILYLLLTVLVTAVTMIKLLNASNTFVYIVELAPALAFLFLPSLWLLTLKKN